MQCTLSLCKNIFRHCWKWHLHLWRSIQYATRWTIKISEYWSFWDLYTVLREAMREAESSVQAQWETWCHIPTAVVSRWYWQNVQVRCQWSRFGLSKQVVSVADPSKTRHADSRTGRTWTHTCLPTGFAWICLTPLFQFPVTHIWFYMYGGIQICYR